MSKEIKPDNFKMLVLIAGIFLSGCIEPRPADDLEKFYFDIEDYFTDQAKLLAKNYSAVEKLLINNNDTQRVVLNNLSWKEELALFINSDINKPAWKDSYVTDSVYDDETLKLISYKSLEDNLPVKQIQIHFSNNIIEHIFIENATRNYVYNSVQVLSYSSGKGFTIEGEQDIILGKDLHYKVIVNFLK
jgi:hypothetical protein